MLLEDRIQAVKEIISSHDLLPGEEKRIESLLCGGTQLKSFKPENRTYNVCLAAVTRDGMAIDYVPDQLRTKEIYTAACKSVGLALEKVPEGYITASMCKDAVNNCGIALRYVPEKFMSVQLCQLAIKSDSKAFSYVPESVLTPAFCAKLLKDKSIESVEDIPQKYRSAQFYEELIELEPDAIYSIPQKFRSASLCKKYLKAKKYQSAAEAIKDDDNIIGMLNPALFDHEACIATIKSHNFKNILKKDINWLSDPLRLAYGSVQLIKLLRFPDVSAQVVKMEPLMMQFVPIEGIDQTVIQEAAKSRNGLRYIPDQLKTKELCEQAFKRDPWSFDDIPDEFITAEMCLAAVKHSGFMLEHVPEDLKTTEMCKIAVADEGNGTPYVPERLYDKELAMLVLKNPGSKVFPLSIIPEEFLDYNMCKYAVSNICGSLKDVPEKYKDYEMCLCAVKKDPRAAQFIPPKFFSPEVAVATAKYPDCFKYIPEDKMTEEACLEAVSHEIDYYGTIMSSIPRRLVTQAICDQAIKTSVLSITGIPDEYITEDMLLYLAEKTPGQLSNHFPKRLKTEELCKKLIEINPAAEEYIED